MVRKNEEVVDPRTEVLEGDYEDEVVVGEGDEKLVANLRPVAGGVPVEFSRSQVEEDAERVAENGGSVNFLGSTDHMAPAREAAGRAADRLKEADRKNNAQNYRLSRFTEAESTRRREALAAAQRYEVDQDVLAARDADRLRAEGKEGIAAENPERFPGDKGD